MFGLLALHGDFNYLITFGTDLRLPEMGSRSLFPVDQPEISLEQFHRIEIENSVSYFFSPLINVEKAQTNFNSLSRFVVIFTQNNTGRRF